MGVTVFDVDTQTPHPGVIVDGSTVQRQTNGGWVTVRSRTPLSPDNHQWGVMILDQGEGNDGSGLMIGLLPTLADSAISTMGSKYISELGGWCLSRAGDCYGSWKCDQIVFTTASVVEFDWDAPSKTLYVVCGKNRTVAHIPSVGSADELYPAISMYYLNQKLAFV